MGRLQAEEMKERMTDLDQMLMWHLQSNHYPPISTSFVPDAKRAIERANEAIFLEDSFIWNEEIVLINGNKTTVGKVIEDLHLDSFLVSE